MITHILARFPASIPAAEGQRNERQRGACVGIAQGHFAPHRGATRWMWRVCRGSRGRRRTSFVGLPQACPCCSRWPPYTARTLQLLRASSWMPRPAGSPPVRIPSQLHAASSHSNSTRGDRELHWLQSDVHTKIADSDPRRKVSMGFLKPSI